MLNSPEKRGRWSQAVRILFTIASLTALFSRFLHPGLLLGFFQDDFFYYLKVADNLAQHGISSFDGIHLTNGYHPLWLLTLTLLRLLLRGAPFFVALQTLTLVSALACYAIAEQIFRRFHLPEPLRDIAAFLVSMQALLLLRYGMEVTLALPLGLWLTLLLLDLHPTASARRLFSIGALASLTILARLDALLLVLPLLLSVLAANRLRSPKQLLPLLLGLSPLPFLYLAVNQRVFHLLTPVSGHAKQLKPLFPPSGIPALSLVHPLDRMKLIFVLPCLLLLAAGLLSAILPDRGLLATTLLAPAPRPRPMPANASAVLLPLLLFPILQIATLSLLSDWVLWPWYFYTFVFSSLASIILLAKLPTLPHPAIGRSLQTAGIALASAYLVYIAAYSVFLPNSIGIYTSSLPLARYMDAHPGIYAMGDQAGTTAFLSSQPVIQLEGLVMDAAFLRKIKAQEPLREILADYGVNFYVTLAPATAQPCLPLREPHQAGPQSPVSTGAVCAAPLATFHRDNVLIDVFDAHTIR